MNSIDRFYATVNREKVDRPAAWLGMPDIKSQPALLKYYGVKNMHEDQNPERLYCLKPGPDVHRPHPASDNPVRLSESFFVSYFP